MAAMSELKTATKESSSELSVFIDEKFDVVISELEEKGWKRCPFQSSRCDLIWTNLARMDWKKVSGSQMVNHFRGSQHLSNKSFLAFHMAVCGKETHMPLQWSAAYQDLAELISMVTLCTVYGACLALLEGAGEAGAEAQKNERIAEVESLLRVLDMDAEMSKSFNTRSAKALLAAMKDSKDLGAALCSVEEDSDGGLFLSKSLVGSKGMWIIKEVGSSCGRGISICAGVREMLQVVESMNFKCVVQKYLERPLLVRDRRKFDIRQWILVKSLNPLVILGYSEFYCRLSKRVYDLSPEHYDDPAMHLCNHAVQSTVEGGAEEAATTPLTAEEEERRCDSMMNQAELEEHLLSLSPPVSLQSSILPQIKRAAVDAVSSVTSSLSAVGSSSFEWLGLDLMVTEGMTVRLIEVNVSPDVSRSTPITARLVKSAVGELLPLVLEEKEEAGNKNNAPGDCKWEQWWPNREILPSGEEKEEEEGSRGGGPARSLSADYSPRKKFVFDRAVSSLPMSPGRSSELKAEEEEAAVTAAGSDSEDEL